MAELQYNVWLDRGRYEEAECVYQEHLAHLKAGGCSGVAAKSSTFAATTQGGNCQLAARVATLEKENREFRKLTEALRKTVSDLSARLSQVEITSGSKKAPEISNGPKPAAKKPEADEDDDDFDLFGSDDEKEEEKKELDPEAERVRQERVAAYEAKKAKKPVLVAKSNLILDVKPWDDETDMAKLEECVRSIEMDGLLWGASKLVPVGYGIKKLQISCVVEDDKVSTDDLEEQIVAFEDYIQSMDIAAFNKI